MWFTYHTDLGFKPFEKCLLITDIRDHTDLDFESFKKCLIGGCDFKVFEWYKFHVTGSTIKRGIIINRFFHFRFTNLEDDLNNKLKTLYNDIYKSIYKSLNKNSSCSDNFALLYIKIETC